MSGKSVRTELAVTMRAPSQALRAVLVTMHGHATTQHSGSTFTLAVDGLLCADAVMLLQSLSTELRVAELTDGPALRARERQVVGHHDAWDLGAALIRTSHCVVLADIQMSLEKEGRD